MFKDLARKYNLSKYEIENNTINIYTKDFKEQEENINKMLKENKNLELKLFNQMYHTKPYYMIHEIGGK